MADSAVDYDRRYLGGILFFNERDFFEAHEVWECLWLDCAAPERSFYQGLIQAAVGLHHFGNGNLRGALKLYHTSKAYMERFPSPYLGLDKIAFWQQMALCFASLLADPDPKRHLRPDETLIPMISLDPPPESWPDPQEFETAEN
jgi:predicted metal-dependent hydrolase